MEDVDVIDGNCMGVIQITPDGFDGNDFNGNDSTETSIPTALMTTSKYSLYYNMKQQKPGMVYIFNHQKFKTDSCPERHGTDKDLEKIGRCFRYLNFDVFKFQDLKLSEVEEHIKIAVNTDHTNYDCFVMVILTHGDVDILWAKDTSYDSHKVIFDQFSADKCPTLAGKPKLFFIQACQGKGLDSGIILQDQTLTRTETDGIRTSYKIPTLADFLIMYATSRGQYAFRNGGDGSYFITTLCDQLMSNAHQENLLIILTKVIQKVAVDFESRCNDVSLNHKKQTPYFQSSLTSFC
ncbi:caspase-1-like isoform X2 [Leptinotarsa decemlineata]|uniref:caspase-1-like isoform X2 n=1 Tax=Leptinotarsa decemlineata TaxID=7539 RepID=UPI003D305A83